MEKGANFELKFSSITSCRHLAHALSGAMSGIFFRRSVE